MFTKMPTGSRLAKLLVGGEREECLPYVTFAWCHGYESATVIDRIAFSDHVSVDDCIMCPVFFIGFHVIILKNKIFLAVDILELKVQVKLFLSIRGCSGESRFR